MAPARPPRASSLASQPLPPASALLRREALPQCRAPICARIPYVMLKIYGERNSGTNYLARLVAKNLEMEVLPGVVPSRIMWLQKKVPGTDLVRDLYFSYTFRQNLGWKHSLVNPERLRGCRAHKRGIIFVTLTKNPYSWLLSLFRRPYHRGDDKPGCLLDFLQAPWRTVRRENALGSYPTPIDLWNHKSAAYLRLQEQLPTVSIRYEELLANPHKMITEIAEVSNCDWRTKSFCNLEESTKDKTKNFTWYRDYYLKERWKADLSPAATFFITSHLHEPTVRALGYELLSETTPDRQAVPGPVERARYP